MAWQDGLLPASFRGIPFFIDSHDAVGGRNAVNHEPPDRESSFAEDMGKMHDGYRIVGHILGDNYFFIRDALIRAMEEKDPGILIHPYLGLIDVQPGKYKFSEDTTEGRICRFDLNFSEAGDPNIVFAIIDIVSKFLSNVVAFMAQAENAIALTVTFTGLPAYVLDSAQEVVLSFLRSVDSAVKEISADADKLATIEKDLADFEADISSIVRDPNLLFQNVDNIVEQLKTLPVDPEETDTIDISAGVDDKVAVLDRVLETAADTSAVLDAANPQTPTRIQENANNVAINNMIKQSAVARKAEVVADKDFRSLTDAVAAREELTLLLDQLMEVEGIDDNLFQAMKDQKASVVEMIPDPRKQTGTLTTLDLLATTNSLALTYDLYESLDRENEILDRNQVENPAFISGEVEVVTGG